MFALMYSIDNEYTLYMILATMPIHKWKYRQVKVPGKNIFHIECIFD